MCNFHSNSLILLGAMLNTRFFLKLMLKVKIQRSGELFVKNMLIFYFLYGYN